MIGIQRTYLCLGSQSHKLIPVLETHFLDVFRAVKRDILLLLLAVPDT